MKSAQISKLILFVLTLILPAQLWGEQIYVTTHKHTIDEIYNTDNDPEGQRKPSTPIIITISTDNGVSVPSIDKDEITSYNIYDIEGVCLCSTSDENIFINTLFSLSGIYEIKLDTNEFSLRGWIQIN